MNEIISQSLAKYSKVLYRLIMEEYLTTSEIAKLLKVNEVTVRRWINRGWLSALKIGKMYRVKNSDIEKLIRKIK